MSAPDQDVVARLRAELHESLDTISFSDQSISFADRSIAPPQRYVAAFVRGRRRRSTRWAVATAVVLVAVAGVVAVTRNHRNAVPAAPTEPQTFTVIQTLATGEQTPAALAAGGSWLFATSWDTGRLLRLDPLTLRTTATLQVGTVRNSAVSIAYGADAVWLLNFADGNLWRVDPNTMTATLKVPLPAEASEVAFGHGAVWVTLCCTSTTTANRQRLLRLDAATGAITGSVVVAGEGETVALSVGQHVVVASQNGPILVIDPLTLKVQRSMADPCDCGDVPGIAEGAHGLYVSSLTSLLRYDTTGRQTATTDLIGNVSPIGAHSDSVWLAQDDQLLRLDPVSLAVTGRAPIAAVGHVSELGSSIYVSVAGAVDKLGPP